MRGAFHHICGISRLDKYMVQPCDEPPKRKQRVPLRRLLDKAIVDIVI
jgi:hypothetical protein